MKKTFLIILVIVMMAGFSTSVFALPPVDPPVTHSNVISNDASAMLLIPLRLAKVNPLNFGSVNLGTGVLGSVTLSALGGAPTYSGGVSTTSWKSTPSVATYTVDGTFNQTYSLTIDPEITLTAASGVQAGVSTMLVNSFTVSYTNTPALRAAGGSVSTLDGTGHDGFSIGGTLNIVDTQASGSYLGHFTASVDYN